MARPAATLPRREVAAAPKAAQAARAVRGAARAAAQAAAVRAPTAVPREPARAIRNFSALSIWSQSFPGMTSYARLSGGVPGIVWRGAGFRPGPVSKGKVLPQKMNLSFSALTVR